MADYTVTISVIELLALEKLAVVGHALAGRILGQAASEQRALVGVLDDVIARAKRGFPESVYGPGASQDR